MRARAPPFDLHVDEHRLLSGGAARDPDQEVHLPPPAHGPVGGALRIDERGLLQAQPAGGFGSRQTEEVPEESADEVLRQLVMARQSTVSCEGKAGVRTDTGKFTER